MVNATSRAAFISSGIQVTRKREINFAGLDLGREFPNTPEDMSSLSLLFQEGYNFQDNLTSSLSCKSLFLLEGFS